MDEKKESILFGQFLKKHSELKLNDDILAKAINIQREESLSTLACRKFGMILLEEFDVFRDSEYLEEYLEKFFRLKESLGLNADPLNDHYRNQ